MTDCEPEMQFLNKRLPSWNNGILSAVKRRVTSFLQGSIFHKDGMVQLSLIKLSTSKTFQQLILKEHDVNLQNCQSPVKRSRPCEALSAAFSMQQPTPDQIFQPNSVYFKQRSTVLPSETWGMLTSYSMKPKLTKTQKSPSKAYLCKTCGSYPFRMPLLQTERMHNLRKDA